jgi:excisionase family DNA binding protein
LEALTVSEFLTTPEIARILRRSVWSVYRDAAAGKIPAHRVRGKLLFDRAEVRAALAGNVAGVPTPDA